MTARTLLSAGLAGAAVLALAAALLIPAPAAAPAPTPTVAAAAQGKALFMAKGCATCHRHGAVAVQGFVVDDGPNLTAYRNDPEVLRRWLSDPASVRPSTQMPKLNLSPAEIEALIAFLNAPTGGP